MPLLKSSDGMYAEWVDVSECKNLNLAFDHKDIIRDALENIKITNLIIKRRAEACPSPCNVWNAERINPFPTL